MTIPTRRELQDEAFQGLREELCGWQLKALESVSEGREADGSFSQEFIARIARDAGQQRLQAMEWLESETWKAFERWRIQALKKKCDDCGEAPPCHCDGNMAAHIALNCHPCEGCGVAGVESYEQYCEGCKDGVDPEWSDQEEEAEAFLNEVWEQMTGSSRKTRMQRWKEEEDESHE